MTISKSTLLKGLLVLIGAGLLGATAACTSSSSGSTSASTSSSLPPTTSVSPTTSSMPPMTSSQPATTAPTSAPPTPTTSPSATSTAGAVTIALTAQNIAFDKSTITVPAGASVTINFNNKDSGVAHNFSLFNDASAAPPALFQGQVITGPATTTYTFKAPTKPGTYFFRCDIHPTIMTGSFVVQ